MTRDKTLEENNIHPYSSEGEVITDIYIYFDQQLLNKDIEIARLNGYLQAYEEQIPRLHDDDCNCILCKRSGK